VLGPTVTVCIQQHCTTGFSRSFLHFPCRSVSRLRSITPSRGTLGTQQSVFNSRIILGQAGPSKVQQVPTRRTSYSAVIMADSFRAISMSRSWAEC
jgi:hypothetical protein